MSTISDRKIVELWGGNARIKNRVLQVLEHTDIRDDLDGHTVAEAIKFLNTLDPKGVIDIDADSYYDSLYAIAKVDHWIDVTPEERKGMVHVIETRNRQKRERDEAEFRRLKVQRPELFK